MFSSSETALTEIEAAGAVELRQFGNYYIVDDLPLTFFGKMFEAGQLGPWAPIAAEAVTGGYRVALKFGDSDQYTIWSLDSGGNFIPGNSLLTGSSATLQSLEASLFQQDLNLDGTIGILTTVIESSGATTLSQVADTYSVGGQTLKFFGAAFAPGQLGDWTPVAAEAVAGAYRVALKFGDSDQYTVWDLDSGGNFIPGNSPLTGSSLVFQSLEASVFHQDVNGDGTTGAVTTVIESSGSTTLSQVADTYSVAGQTLKFFGTVFAPGQLGDWTPIGAEAVAGGYQVVLKFGTADQYTVWTLDSGGNFIPGNSLLTGSSATLQALEASLFQQDLNLDGTIGILTTVIESSGATTLSQVADTYSVGGQTLKFFGTVFAPGQLGDWTPIGAEAVAGGYQVVLRFGAADQYTVWNLDGAGYFIPGNSLLAGSSATLQALEASLFQQDLNGDGTIGIDTTVIESSGSTTLSQIADIYSVGGQTLMFFGAPLAPGQLGDWTPVGAEAVGSGYRVALRLGDTDQYTVWTLDSAGNFIPGNATMFGASLAFQSLESSIFQQDVNGDGTVGVATTVIESAGATTLSRVADTYSVGGQTLMFFGAPLAPGQLGDWAPVAAEAVGSGYRVALRLGDTDQYTVWTLDSAANFVPGNSTLSGLGSAFQSLEASIFQQDVNGDGTTGIFTTVIEAAGATTLSRAADAYVVGGQVLKLSGSQFTLGQMGDWAPIGAEAVGSGYQLVMRSGASDQYAVWTLDAAGNVLPGEVRLSGFSSTLQSLEASLFQQDLNGDGTAGIATAVVESAGATTLTRIADTYRIDSLTLKMAGATVTMGQVGGWMAIGAEATAEGYDVVWKNPGADQYAVWRVDSNGNYVSSTGTISGSTLGAGYYEYLFQQDLNQDGQSPQVTVIESVGELSLVKAGNGYFMVPEGGGIGVQLHRDGTVLTGQPGQSGAWLPVAVEYDSPFIYLALKQVGTNRFEDRWVDDDGDVGPWSFGPGYSSASSELMNLEESVQQDLNGNGIIGSAMVTIESRGDGSLYRSTITNTYYLGQTDGPELKINGVAVTAGDVWKPIAVGTYSAPYLVALKAGSDQYWIGYADSSGNFSAFSFGTVSGNSYELKIYEANFEQDLNGDGVIGFPDGVIEATGTARLAIQGNSYYVYQTGSNIGVQLKNADGTAMIADASYFNPVGVEWTEEYGFQVVTRSTNSDFYGVEDVGSTGKFKANQIGVLNGGDLMLKAAEGIFQQDFNRDGTTGVPSTGAFDIDLHFHGDGAYRLFFEAAAARWEQIITADIADDVSIEHGAIDDVRIDVTVDAIDGVDGVLGQATPDDLRFGSWLPIHGVVSIDSADLVAMKNDNTLLAVITHEIGHVLGIGSLWSLLGLTDSFGYVGEYALDAYRQLSGDPSADFIPLETEGGAGTAGSHWSEDAFGRELMTGFIEGANNPLSILTIATLRDLGYSVDYAQAEPYNLA